MKPPKPYIKLREALNSLPEIGPITAERLVQYLIFNREKRENLINSLRELDRIGLCKFCGMICEGEICEVCADENRENVVLVVRSPFEVFRVEDSGKYKGRYFVIYHLISPSEGISAEKIPKEKFEKFLENFKISEIIIGLPNDVKGEVTAYFLVEGIKGIKISRLPSGVPRGEDISSLDPYTLYEALTNRVPFEL
ncbi:toprim domain-containing protein [Candidatus Caldipriscus sp.]|jgi:recombination protein RecR|nr:toprim domain-containing protein [Candidatus Caldipriscus sp.]